MLADTRAAGPKAEDRTSPPLLSAQPQVSRFISRPVAAMGSHTQRQPARNRGAGLRPGSASRRQSLTRRVGGWRSAALDSPVAIAAPLQTGSPGAATGQAHSGLGLPQRLHVATIRTTQPFPSQFKQSSSKYSMTFPLPPHFLQVITREKSPSTQPAPVQRLQNIFSWRRTRRFPWQMGQGIFSACF
jgi:hypothetical protein